MRLIGETNIPFISWRRIAFVLSSLMILTGIVSLIGHGGPRYGVDFTGGVLLQVKFEKPIDIAKLRQRLGETLSGNFELQRFGELNEAVVRTQEVESTAQLTGQISSVLNTHFSDNPFEIVRTEVVGPKIGGELKEKALLAIIYSMVGILIYITWRFEFRFAVAAIIALIHDVLITVGVFSIADKEISLAIIAALLTIVGYSLNDTIVVFDRIREDIHLMRREKFEKVVDLSINQTLSRTIITSGTTLFVVISLFALGGEVIREFAFALLVGVAVGTYSSIFVASPILVEWQERYPKATNKAR